MRRNLIRYLPEVLKRSLDIRIIMEVQESAMQDVWDAAQAVFDDQFISTADEYGISRYEEILGLVPRKGEDLETRRSEVLMAWAGLGGHSIQTIQTICDAWHPGYIKAGYEPGYVILELLAATGYQIPRDFPALLRGVGRVKPANLGYRYMFCPEPRPLAAIGYVAFLWVYNSAGYGQAHPEPASAVCAVWPGTAAEAVTIHVTIPEEV